MARRPTGGKRPTAPERRALLTRATAKAPVGPYGRMSFRVVIDDIEIGLCHVSALHWLDEANADPELRQAVTLRRAVGADRTLYRWRAIHASGKDSPRQVTVMLLAGPGGKPVGIWRLVDARPIRWTGPELDAMSDGIAYEELEIGYERIDWRTRL